MGSFPFIKIYVANFEIRIVVKFSTFYGKYGYFPHKFTHFLSWRLRTFWHSFRKNSTVTCESLVSREFSRIFFIFHLSISISRLFNFTFTSRKEWNQKSIHFSFLEKSEKENDFTFHFSKKVKAIQISLFFLEKKEWNHISATVHFGRILM